MKRTFILILLATTLLACQTNSPSTAETVTANRVTTALTTITATDLMTAYRGDAAAANQRYKGKTFIVTGKVDIATSDEIALSTENSQGSVYCKFSPPATKVAEGQPVKIRGTVSEGSAANVTLQNCVLVP